MLLYWGIIQPDKQSKNLAAVRFSSAVRIKSIRLFPTNARPFENQQDIVACTEPSSMYLDVFFNAISVGGLDGLPKQKPSNVLVPTTITYPGGQMDFCVDMDYEFATRLMIVRGAFTSLTLAVYGEAISQPPVPVSSYEPRALPHVETNPLSLALDPSRNTDPTSLARGLLTLIPESPDLLLVVRLMFCLKPSNEDWDRPEFPHIYSDLKQEFFDLTLNKAAETVSRPVSDSEDVEVIREFALRVIDCIVSYDDDEAYLFAKILSHCASQNPSLAQSLVQYVDLESLFSVHNLERSTLLYLLDAAANFDIAKNLKSSNLLDTLSFIRSSSSYKMDTRQVADRLYGRLVGWDTLEDALSNTQSSFSIAAAMISDVALEETSFGVWLATMLSHQDILDRLAETAAAPHLLPHPPPLWTDDSVRTHDEFIAFVRAFIGVASVVAVYAWSDSSDSVPVEICRERSLTILRQWQAVDGYREIVNHLLLMRQMVYRLKYMLPAEDDLPSRSGLDAEHMLKSLALQPNSMLRQAFVEVVRGLPSQLNYITDDEILIFRKAADTAHGGLQEVVRVLVDTGVKLEDWDCRLQLRIALAVVSEHFTKDMDGNADLQVSKAVWEEGQSSLSPILISHLASINSIISDYFSLKVPPRLSQAELASLFQSCTDLFNVLMALLPSHPVPSRDISLLARTLSDIFVCTDSADMSFSQEGAACSSAHVVRQRIVNTMSSMVFGTTSDARQYWQAKLVLVTLLECAFTPGERDAGHHMTQVFWLFDHTLPSRQSWDSEALWLDWINRVLPGIIPQLRQFYTKQEGDNRVHLIRRFLNLDEGHLGIAGWLLSEEHRLLYDTIRSARRSTSDAGQRALYQWRIGSSLQVLTTLLQSSSPIESEWIVNGLLREDESASALEKNLVALVVQNVYHESMGLLAILLAEHCKGVSSRLRSALLSILFRATRCRNFRAFSLVPVLLSHGLDILADQAVLRDLGAALQTSVEGISAERAPYSELSEAVVQVLGTLVNRLGSETPVVIPAISSSSLNEIFTSCANNISPDLTEKLENIKGKLSAAECQLPALTILSSGQSLELPFGIWQDMLSPPTPVPSTPKRKSPAQSAELAGLVTVSPPNAILRSPEVRGLTKTYMNNDFRELRHLSSTRQNTSRLPSMHVDDFEQGPSPIAPLNLNSPTVANFPTPPRPPSLPANPMTLMNAFNYQGPQQ